LCIIAIFTKNTTGMHVTFISLCEAKSIGRTRAVLDRYAIRAGVGTWVSPITSEALNEVKKALCTIATRQTAVACYKNVGARKMRLAWVVGSRKKFGINGEVPVGSRIHGVRSKERTRFSLAVAAVSSISGRLHDIGKANLDFQRKLTPQNNKKWVSDPVRHDLVSAIVVKRLMEGMSWDEAWKDSYISKNDRLVGKSKFGMYPMLGVSKPSEAVLYCILTHHKMLGDGCTAHDHVHFGGKQTSGEFSISSDCDASSVRKLTERLVAKMIRMDEENILPASFWCGVAYTARAALVLADHHVSADTSSPFLGDPQGQLFANTSLYNASRGYNQTLKYHLAKVGCEAGKLADTMLSMELPALNDDAVVRLLSPANSRFEWQNRAAAALTPGVPALVMNIAATGAGKTRMNARAAAVLAGDSPVRITAALNLRSLTLQTGMSYREDLGLDEEDLAVVVGSALALKMQEYDEDADPQDMDIVRVEEQLLTDALDTSILPESLVRAIGGSKSKGSVVMAPFLVSTTDYIIAAGDPRLQAAHAVALTRLMHSDLILDEVDGYDPPALAAVLRLVKLSAMFGRNVVVSSGTLPPVIAKRVYESYASGFECFMEAGGAQEFHAVVIDNLSPPSVITSDFEAEYKAHVLEMLRLSSAGKVTKKARIAHLSRKTPGDLTRLIMEEVGKLHAEHRWGPNISLGLIRVANIKEAIPLARSLSGTPGNLVCCYHSRHLAIQRFWIEHRLKKILTRKADSSAPLKDEDIDRAISAANGGDVRVIVVATPVEEVGQDHDFDWAIIEPSSAQSIVQTAGRVNRHRLIEVVAPNISILQYNFKEVSGGHKEVFSKPGCESDGSHFDHDVQVLISEAHVLERLDASLRFRSDIHKFSSCDDLSIERMLGGYVDPFIGVSPEARRSNETSFYREACLRDIRGKDDFFCTADGKWYQRFLNEKPALRSGVFSIDIGRSLFSLSLEEMSELARDVGVDADVAMSIQVGAGDRRYLLSEFGLEATGKAIS